MKNWKKGFMKTFVWDEDHLFEEKVLGLLSKEMGPSLSFLAVWL